MGLARHRIVAVTRLSQLHSSWLAIAGILPKNGEFWWMSHLLLSTLIAGSFHTRLPSSFTLFFLMLVLMLSPTPWATLELSTTSLPLSPSTSPNTADRDRRGCNTMAVASPSTHNTLAVHAQLRL
jgi:hypothetical protein